MRPSTTFPAAADLRAESTTRRRQRLSARMPVPKITPVLAAAALLVSAWPWLAELCVYRRDAVFDGQLWRLATASLVHFSPSHLFWNLAVLLTVGCTVEVLRSPGFGRTCLLALVLPGLLLLLWQPDVARYGGLSATACAAVTCLCLHQWYGVPRGRLLWLAILAGLLAKIALEAALGTALFAELGAKSFRPLPGAHLTGVTCAVAVFVHLRLRRAPARGA